MAGISVGEAFVTIRPDTAGFGGAAEAGIGKPMRRLVLAIEGMFAAVGAKRIISGWVSEAMEAARAGAQTEAVIKSTGGTANVTAGHVGTLARRLSELAGVDDEAIQASENWLLTFKNIKNVGADKIFDDATRAAVDLAASMAAKGGGTTADSLAGATTMLGKALNDPLVGMTALQRAGVTLTAAQKKQVEAFVAVGDVASAQKIILGEVASQTAGSAAAQATAADKMKVIWDNLREDMGKAILPAINEILPAFKGLVADIGPVLKPFAKSIGQGLGGAFKLIGPVIQAFLPVLQSLMPVILRLGEAIAPIIPAVAALAAAAAEALIPVINALIPILEPLIAAFAQVFTEVAKSGVLMELGQAFVAVLQALMPLLPVLVQLILALTPIIVIATQIAAVLINVLAVAVGVVVNAFLGAAGWIKGAWDTIKSAATTAWTWIHDKVLKPMGDIITGVAWIAVTAWNGIKAGFEAMKGALHDAWIWLKRKVIDPMIDAFNTIIGLADKIFGAGGASSSLSGAQGKPLTGTIGQHAAGGLASGWSWIGEDGPELAFFRSPTPIKSNRDSMAMVGANVVVDAAELHLAARELRAAVRMMAAMNVSPYDAVTAARIG